MKIRHSLESFIEFGDKNKTYPYNSQIVDKNKTHPNNVEAKEYKNGTAYNEVRFESLETGKTNLSKQTEFLIFCVLCSGQNQSRICKTSTQGGRTQSRICKTSTQVGRNQSRICKTSPQGGRK